MIVAPFVAEAPGSGDTPFPAPPDYAIPPNAYAEPFVDAGRARAPVLTLGNMPMLDCGLAPEGRVATKKHLDQ